MMFKRILKSIYKSLEEYGHERAKKYLKHRSAYYI